MSTQKNQVTLNRPTIPETGFGSVRFAAQALGVSRMTIYRLIRAGRLPVQRISERTTRIDFRSLRALIEGR